MKQEAWEYITAHWGDSNPEVMEQVSKYRDESDLEEQNLNKSLEDAREENRKLTQQNVDVNKTNMALIMRLTDPTLPPPKKDEEYEAPKFNDYNAFVK